MFDNILILAGGKSRRFWPLSDKNLFFFLGQSLIEYQLRKYFFYTNTIFLIVNKDNYVLINDVVKKIKLKKEKKIKILIQKEKGQAGALLSIKNLIKGNILVLNNNDVFEEKELFSNYLKNKEKYSIILTARKTAQYFPGGYLKFFGKKIIGVVEKPPPNKTPSNFYKLMVDYFSHSSEFIKIISQMITKFKDRDDVYERALDFFLKKKGAFLVQYQDHWATLKYPWHILLMMNFFLSKLKKNFFKKNVFIDKKSVIEGPVFIEEGVKILAFSKIVGPAYIGKNTVIGNFALVRQSMIGNNCLIGGYSEVTRSYLGNNVMLHRNYLGDSVIENDVLFGAGAVCANFRFDEKEIFSLVKEKLENTQLKKLGAIIGSRVKIGVNASIMPGVKIGLDCCIMPGVVVKRDVKKI